MHVEWMSRWLEVEVGLEVLSDFTDKVLEGELPDEELHQLLITTDFTESDGSVVEPSTCMCMHISNELAILSVNSSPNTII